MLNREFLESYPLYRKSEMDLKGIRNNNFLREFAQSSNYADAQLPKPAINMYCAICRSAQTFNPQNTYESGFERSKILNIRSSTPGGILEVLVARLIYQCSLCRKYLRHFAIKFDFENNYVMKIGQEPPWDIRLDPALERVLGAQANHYKKALISESQGYGIGAFAYYRRIVDELIDGLLDDIPDLMAGEEREKYLAALQEAKQTTVTQQKIDLVKDKLPVILRPGGRNPLSRLHGTLSEGLHRKSDERCMELAEAVRETLVFLVTQIETTKSASARYVESMDRLQEDHYDSAP